MISGPNLAKEIARREPAASVVACADEDVAKMLQDRVPLAGVPSLHLGRRARLRARRRLQERRRPRGRHGRRPRLRRQHHRVGDHPRPRRDRAAGHQARRQPADPDGPGRPRRPGRHLLLAAVAQPHLRREARPGHDAPRRSYASTRQVAEGAKSCASLRALAERTGVDAPVAQYVDDVVAGRMTAKEMMDATLSRETKAETDCPKRHRYWPSRSRSSRPPQVRERLRHRQAR